MASLEYRIGELFMVGYPGTDPSAACDLIERHRVGGIILFSRNIRDAAHAHAVCRELQEMRRQVSDTPLFIALDQEGGCVARITEGVTVFPGNMALGAIGADDCAQQVGRVTGIELAALGFNVNFAPVLDISSNPRNPGIGARSFGSEPGQVSRLGAAMIRGLQQGGVWGTAKHFPGLGEAKVDSHDELPAVDLPRERLEKMELLPFREAVAADVAFVMTAHCSFPALDASGAPATLSRYMLADLLRDEMDFQGIVITDCLEMGAVEKRHPASEAAVLAFRAGADLLLICHTREKQTAAMEALAHSVETGDISDERLEASLSRIRTIKERMSDQSAPHGYTLRRELSESVAARAITLVMNEGGFLPLRLRPAEKLAVVIPSFELLTKVEESAQHGEAFVREMKRFHPNLTHHEIPVRPNPAESDRVLEGCREADAIVIVTYNLHLNPAQRECAQALVDLGKPAVVAAVRDPHDLVFVRGARASLATYSFRECSLKALAGALFGHVKPTGVLPARLC